MQNTGKSYRMEPQAITTGLDHANETNALYIGRSELDIGRNSTSPGIAMAAMIQGLWLATVLTVHQRLQVLLPHPDKPFERWLVGLPVFVAARVDCSTINMIEFCTAMKSCPGWWIPELSTAKDNNYCADYNSCAFTNCKCREAHTV